MIWDFKVYKPETYRVVVVSHVTKNQNWEADGSVRAYVSGQSVENQLIEYKRVKTVTMLSKIMDSYANIGTVKIDSPSAHTFTLEIASDFTGAKPRIQSVMLIPVTK